MGRLSTDLMESLLWLQLAEMELAVSRLPWSGEMEKSDWGCGGTPLGLLRMLITCGEARGDPGQSARGKRAPRAKAPTMQLAALGPGNFLSLCPRQGTKPSPSQREQTDLLSEHGQGGRKSDLLGQGVPQMGEGPSLWPLPMALSANLLGAPVLSHLGL